MDLSFSDSSRKLKAILQDSIDLERRRRQLAMDTNQLLKRVQELKTSEERYILQGWINKLLDDLR